MKISTYRKLFCAAVLMTAFTANASTKGSLKDFSVKIKEASEQFIKIAKDARGSKETIVQNRTFADLVTKLNLDSKDQNRLAQAIADGKVSIVTAMYASVAAKQLVEQGEKSVAGYEDGITSIMKVAAVAKKGNATDVNLAMTKDEMSDASNALQKKTEYSAEMLSWSKEDADLHINVMKKTAEIYEKLQITPEEALVMAIMEVKGVDKAGAMKIVRKLKDCV